MVIHGLLVTCLDHLPCIFNCLKWCFKLFEMVLCVCLKDILKRGHCCGNLCNDPCFNVYKGVLSFEKFFNVLKVVLKLCVECGFEK